MGRLNNISPQLATVRPLVDRPRDAWGHSTDAEPWRKWYSWAKWKALRLRVFIRDLFTCQMPDCGRLEGDTSKLVADHIQPHRGDPAMFWDENNVQTLCKPCHDSAKQAAERRPFRL